MNIESFCSEGAPGTFLARNDFIANSDENLVDSGEKHAEKVAIALKAKQSKEERDILKKQKEVKWIQLCALFPGEDLNVDAKIKTNARAYLNGNKNKTLGSAAESAKRSQKKMAATATASAVIGISI